MSQSQKQSGGFPSEYWLFVGIALAASGHLPTFVAVIIVYLLLKRFRPDIEADLLLIASGFWGAAFIEVFKITAWGRSPSLLWEQVIITAAATILISTRRRSWAWVLFTYCVLGTLIFLSMTGRQPSPDAQRFAVARATLYFFGAWLIARWLHRQQLASGNAETTRTVVVAMALTMVWYWAWVAAVVWFSFRCLFPTRVADWIGRAKVKTWIAESGIPPTVGIITSLLVWFALTGGLVLLPLWILKRRRATQQQPTQFPPMA